MNYISLLAVRLFAWLVVWAFVSPPLYMLGTALGAPPPFLGPVAATGIGSILLVVLVCSVAFPEGGPVGEVYKFARSVWWLLKR